MARPRFPTNARNHKLPLSHENANRREEEGTGPEADSTLHPDNKEAFDASPTVRVENRGKAACGASLACDRHELGRLLLRRPRELREVFLTSLLEPRKCS